MKRILLCVLLAASLQAAVPRRPKLVLAIVIDQLRYDYLTRFRPELHAGLDRLLNGGAVFTNARFIHFPTVTAVGHSTFLTGATPSVSGIVGNDWYDWQEHNHVTSVSDSSTQLLGGSGGSGSSPRRLLVSTVGDELKLAHGDKSRVIGISLKDRASILPSGHAGDGAYWFDPKSGNWVSSTYYFPELPAWVKKANLERPGDHYKNVTWLNHKMPDGGSDLYMAIDKSPFGNELIERFAERALESEQLGKHENTDLLTISFSSNDYVGHEYGPFSPEEREVVLRTDEYLARLFQAIDRQVGMDNVMVVLTGDHGVVPSAEESAAARMPGGRLPTRTVANAIQAALAKKYGDGTWVLGNWDLSIYLNHDLEAQRNLDPAEVDRVAAQAAFAVPHVLRVYTREQLRDGAVVGDEMSRRMENGFNERRSPDIAFLPEPYWQFAGIAATHGSTWGYDSHVPVVFMGAGIRPGEYDGSVIVNDIAPTLATILRIETPSGSIGRVLNEMFTP